MWLGYIRLLVLVADVWTSTRQRPPLARHALDLSAAEYSLIYVWCHGQWPKGPRTTVAQDYIRAALGRLAQRHLSDIHLWSSATRSPKSRVPRRNGRIYAGESFFCPGLHPTWTPNSYFSHPNGWIWIVEEVINGTWELDDLVGRLLQSIPHMWLAWIYNHPLNGLNCWCFE